MPLQPYYTPHQAMLSCFWAFLSARNFSPCLLARKHLPLSQDSAQAHLLHEAFPDFFRQAMVFSYYIQIDSSGVIS